MATLKDLFKSKKNELYGLSDNIRITSLGLINPPRGAALLTSSPDALADLIGNQIGGAFGGSANRPTDTIFNSNTPFSKPISLFKTRAGLQTAVDGAKKDYFIKDNPAPTSLFAKYKQGATSPLDMALNIAKDALNKVGGKKGKANKLKQALNDRNNAGEGYGTKYRKLDIGSKPLQKEHKFSKWYPEYVQQEGDNGKSWVTSKLKERGFKASWDIANSVIQNKEFFKDAQALKDSTDFFRYSNQVWVTFKKYGTKEIVPLAGAISGLSEDLSPEWSDFKYVGSPFKIYKYGGVERSLKFELKLYYTTEAEKYVMIKKINFLKSLVFPYDDVIKATYSGLDEYNTPLSFAPNLVYVSIDGLYANTLGIVDSLSFSIDENTTWSNFNPNMESDSSKKNKLYPSVINFSYSMKIIEQHKTETKSGITKYKYDFDGYNADGKEYINTTSEFTKAAAAPPMAAGSGVRVSEPKKTSTFDPSFGIPNYK